MVPYFWLLLCWLAAPLRALEISEEEVKYVDANVTAKLGSSVTLGCGDDAPHMFIWGFTKPKTGNNVAITYIYRHGARVQPQSSSLGRMTVPEKTSALVIEKLQREAVGTYTCQAVCLTEQGFKITYYETRLDVED